MNLKQLEPEKKNFYLLTQDEYNVCEYYSVCIVCATCEDEAILISPTDEEDEWPEPEYIKAKLIGICTDDDIMLNSVVMAEYVY